VRLRRFFALVTPYDYPIALYDDPVTLSITLYDDVIGFVYFAATKT
jgi:hypothetical protein